MSISLLERDFVLKCLESNTRTDGRGVYDLRPLKISLGPFPGIAVVQLGKTRVLSSVSANIVRPLPSKPTEGIIRFHTEYSPMAAPTVEQDQASEDQVLLSRMLEKSLRKSGAVDTEGLCIVASEKVWEIRVETIVLDDEGNVLDTATIAAISALSHFKRPDVTVTGDEITVHTMEEKNPIPLAIHHIPISCTFGLYNNGAIVVDPSLIEESCQDGQLTFVTNIHREMCAMTKYGGTPLTSESILNCCNIASIKATEITLAIKEALKQAQANSL